MAGISSSYKVREEHMWDIVDGPSPFSPAADEDTRPNAPSPVQDADELQRLTRGRRG